MNTVAGRIVELTLVAFAGLAAFIAPIVIDPPAVLPKAPLFPMIREAVEHLRPSSFIALAGVGLVAGVLARAPWPLLGLASVALFPVCTAAELIADSTSHNLFPFELVMYAVFSIPPILAAGVGRVVRPLLAREGRGRNRGVNAER